MAELQKAESPAAEIAYLAPRGDRIWSWIFCFILFFFSTFAVFDLFHPRLAGSAGVLGSVLWLAFVGLTCGSDCKQKGGLPNYLALCQGNLAGRHFIRLEQTSSHVPLVCFGYYAWGRRFYRLKVRLAGLVSVDWGMGQASGMCGKDMHDWHVFIWYESNQTETSLRRRHLKNPKSVHCFGQGGRKAVAEAFGLRFVELLRNGGVTLAPGSNGCQYLRPEKAAPNS